PSRARAHGDNEAVGRDALRFRLPRHLDHRRLEKFGGSPNELNAVAVEGVTNRIELVVDDLGADRNEVADGDVALHPVTLAEQAALAAARQMDGRFAQCLGRYGPGIDLRATDGTAFLDRSNAFAQLGGLYRRFLTSRARAYDDQVVMAHICTLLGLGGTLTRDW